jgi:ABC-type Na+ efflux pump permease subunit
MFKSSTGGGTAFASIETKLAGGSPDDPRVPPTVRKAGRFMLAGAAVTVVVCVFQVLVTIIDKNLINVNGKPPTSSQLTLGIIILVVSYAVYVALWILMARFTRAGQNWARIVSSVLFAIATWQLYSTINSLQAGVTITISDVVFIVLMCATWAAGVGAVALLWRGESSLYFKGLYAPRRR